MHLEKSGGSRQVTRVARRFSAYLPQSLTTQLLARQMPEPGRVRWLNAATLFCDVSGFSAMANELAADGSRGAEELNRLLLMIFTAMINAIHNAGGMVVHFHGDAMLVCIPDDDGQAARNALSCAQFMQNLMRGSAYSQVVASRPNNRQTIYELSMKVGVGYGRCAEIVVGDLEESLEYVVGGDGVDDAINSEKHASAGQVIASAAVLEKANFPYTEPFSLFTDLMPVPFARNRIHWDAYDGDTLWCLAETAANFVPPALHSRITEANAYYVAENRPITSMFVQFLGVDYNDDAVGEQLQAYYKWACRLVDQFGGENSRVNRILTGDKGNVLHIIFGAPMAPDAPEQALMCAWQMQKQKPDFITEQCIGVAAGEAFACAIGSQTRREYTIMGEVVNLSARLMTECAPGEVWVDESTSRRASQLILFDEIGLVPLKGYSQPQPLFKIRGDVKRSRRGAQNRDILPLLWRQQEVETLQAVLKAGSNGRSECVVAYGSIPSELARFASLGSAYWQDLDGRVIFGVGQQNTADFPYGLWRNVWRAYFDYLDQDHISRKVRQVTNKINDACPDLSSDMPLLEKVVGFAMPMSATHLQDLSSMEEQSRLYALLMNLLLAEAEKQPLLLIFEDLHWTDAESMRFLHYLIRSSYGTKLALVLTFIPQESFALNQLPKMGYVLPFGYVPVASGRVLVQKMLEIETLPNELLAHLGLKDETGTVNPIVLEENVKRLRDENLVVQNGHIRFDEAMLSNIKAPNDLHGVVLSKLDNLSPNGHMLLQAASIIGRQFDFNLLSQTIVPSIGRRQARLLFQELVEQGLVTPLQAGEVYLFQGDMVQDIAYKSIPFRRRQLWHATVAQWLVKQEGSASMQPLIAYHYGQTDLYEDGLRFSLYAAEGMQNQSKAAAIELYNLAENHLRGLGFDAQWKLAVRLYLARAALYNSTEQFAKGEKDGETAIRLAYKHGEPSHVDTAYNRLAYAKLRLGKWREAFEVSWHVIAQLGSDMPIVDLAYAHIYAAEGLLYLGQFDRAQDLFKRGMSLFEDAGHAVGLAYGYLMWGHEYSGTLGDWATAQKHLVKGREYIQQSNNTHWQLSLRFFIGLAHVELSSGSLDLAMSCLQQAGKICEERELKWWLPAVYYYEALVHVGWRRQQKARDLLRLGLTAVRQGNNPDYLPLLLLELSHLEPDKELGRAYLYEGREAAKKRARYFDRKLCLQAPISMPEGTLVGV